MKNKSITIKRRFKNEKLLAGLSLSTVLLLSACGADTAEETVEGGLQDGTYAVEELNFSETGWKESLEVVVASGEITDATWTSVNEEGLNKLEDENYQETMTKTSGTGPQDFIPELEEALVASQDPAEVEVVTGATGTSDKFVDYAKQIVAAAEAGETETIELDNTAE